MDISEINKVAKKLNEFSANVQKATDRLGSITEFSNKLGGLEALTQPLSFPSPLEVPPPRPVRPIHSEILEAIKEGQDAGSSKEIFKHLTKRIEEFAASLDDTHEVGIQLVAFGQAVTFHAQQISYIQPALIVFEGVNDASEPVALIQHVSQLSYLMLKVKRQNPEEPKQPIGFIWTEEN